MTAQNPPTFIQAGSHPAEDVRRHFSALTQGRSGISAPGDLAVTEKGTPDMSVDVAGGSIYIAGDEATYQGTYFCENRGTTNLTVAASDATNDRKDLVVAKVQDSDYSGATDAWSLAIVTGTPAATPLEPTAPDNSVILALLDVTATSTTVTNSDITDRRETETEGQAAALGGTIVTTDANKPASPVTGQKVWLTDKDREELYDGTRWLPISGKMPSAKALRTTALTIGDSAWTAASLSTSEDWDTDTLHSTSTNPSRFTIPTGLQGKWRVYGFVQFDADATGMRGIQVSVNGTQNGRGMFVASVASLSDIHIEVTEVVEVTAGDYIEIEIYQSSGGNLSANEVMGMVEFIGSVS